VLNRWFCCCFCCCLLLLLLCCVVDDDEFGADTRRTNPTHTQPPSKLRSHNKHANTHNRKQNKSRNTQPKTKTQQPKHKHNNQNTNSTTQEIATAFLVCSIFASAGVVSSVFSVQVGVEVRL